MASEPSCETFGVELILTVGDYRIAHKIHTDGTIIVNGLASSAVLGRNLSALCTNSDLDDGLDIVGNQITENATDLDSKDLHDKNTRDDDPIESSEIADVPDSLNHWVLQRSGQSAAMLGCRYDAKCPSTE